MATADRIPRSLQVDLTRGVCGGCLFAMPLIFTMEMWWLGYDISTLRAVSYMGVALGCLYGLNALSGYRTAHGFAADLGDAFVSLAIGILVAAVMLVTLGELSSNTSLLVALRQTILLALPVSLGVSLSRSQLTLEPGEVEGTDTAGHALAHRLGVTSAGALLFGMSAAPTEEIRMIVSRVDWPHLIAMTATALALTWATLFIAAFPRQHVRRRHASHLGEALLIYAVGLLLSTVMLWALGFRGGQGSLAEILAAIVTLGLPTTIGAAAGRLIL